MNVGRMIAYYDGRVARGEMTKVWRGLAFDYKLTEKGREAVRQRMSPLREKELAEVRRLALEDPPAAQRLRFNHLHTGLFRLDEQPEIPGFPLETAESLAHPPAPEKPEMKERKRPAAQIIVGR